MDETERQIALVTGGSRGIGRAIAIALGRSGRHVLVNYRSNREAAEETVRLVQDAGGTAEPLPFDVSDGGAVDTALAAVMEKYGTVAVLVNNAGNHLDNLMVWTKPEEWRQVLDVNLTGFYHVTRPIVKAMVLNRFGRIITIASTSGQVGVAGQVSYSAAKAGLIGATKALAKEVAKRGVTVNAVAPGFIETDMLEGLDRKELLRAVPMQRVGTPEEVAAVVVFLCEPLAGYVTGQVIGVNGGVV